MTVAAILKLAAFFVAMVGLGTFADGNGQVLMFLGLIEGLAVLWLTVDTGRVVARAPAGPGGRAT